MAAPEVEVRVPHMRYDITMPLIEGKIQIPGVRLVIGGQVQGTVMNAESPIRTGEFGLVDLNWGNLSPAIEAGWEVIGLPVFSKRKPVFTYIFCRADRGIESPRDLEGKRIATGRYRSAVTIWIRGLLQHRYGVDLSKLTWVVNSDDYFPLHDPAGTIVKSADPKKPVSAALLDGEVDAIMGDISDGELFRLLEADKRVKRLFPDYFGEHRSLVRDTGIFPPVHLIAMSRKLDREHPEVAGKLFTAFEQAKAMAFKENIDDRGGLGLIDYRERIEAQMQEWGDIYPYGITPNKPAIDSYNQYSRDQGTVATVQGCEDMFASSTLDT